jgi:hypothetical protein
MARLRWYAVKRFCRATRELACRWNFAQWKSSTMGLAVASRGVWLDPIKLRFAAFFQATKHNLFHVLRSNAVVILLRERMIGWLQPEMRAHTRLLNVRVHFEIDDRSSDAMPS